jgi:hypothetical protein
MDGVTNRYFAKTADPSTALRSGRDDKGRGVAYRKVSDPDGQSYEPLLRDRGFRAAIIEVEALMKCG